MAEVDAVVRMANILTRNPTEAEDLVQDTYLKAVGARERFELDARGIRPWLMRILHNTWLNRVQRRGREPASMDPETVDQMPGARSSASPIDLDWRNADQRLVNGIQQLPDSLRTTLLLWALEELTYREIAEITAVPIGTVMSRLYRARQLLAERLAELVRRAE